MSDPLEEFIEETEVKEPPRPKPKRRPGCFLNILSGIFVAGTLVVGLLFAIIFFNPQSGLNPLKPTTLPPPVKTHTPSPTPQVQLPPTFTIIPTATATPTDTPIPTDTPEPTPEETPMPTANLEGGTSFTIQSGSPSYEQNSVHPDLGCSWMGVAGQVFDVEGAAVNGIYVDLGGSIGDEDISMLALTGVIDDYGDGGYEIILNDSPIASEGIFWIQLTNGVNQPMSDKIYFQTFDSCDSNLVKINFEGVAE